MKHYEFFMKTALEEALAALERNEFPVGCVIVHDNRIIATGSRTGTTMGMTSETDHAEMNALRNLALIEADGAKIEKSEITIYATMEPCLMCLGAIILSGIKKIVYAYEDVMGGGTGCDMGSLTPLYKESGIRIVPGVMRDQSLVLFKRFFSNSENVYWKDSLLARYTLEQ